MYEINIFYRGITKIFYIFILMIVNGKFNVYIKYIYTHNSATVIMLTNGLYLHSEVESA